MAIDLQELALLPPQHEQQGHADDAGLVRPAVGPSLLVTRENPPETGRSAIPAQLLLGALPHPLLRLRAPLSLRVDTGGDVVVVWSEELEEFGYGRHLTEAVEDFQQTVIELYLTLRRDARAGRLGPAMQALWQRLQRVVEPRR